MMDSCLDEHKAQKSARPVRPAHVAVSEKPEQPQSHQGQPRSSPKENHQSARQQQRTDFGPRQAGSMQSVRASPSHASPSTTNQDDVAEKAAQAARYAMQDFSKTPVPMPQQQSSLPDESSMKVQPLSTSQEAMKESTPQIQYHFEHPLHPNVPAPPPPYYQSVPYQTSHQAQHQWNDVSPGQLHRSLGVQQGIPYPTQSAPTQVLYEQARMAATAKASPNHRRVGHPSQRRPWTTEEESSLMAGLDRVKGPHWSQILAMFGPGGTINEILKDRNQVQLKDKARNLKLFFLKSGIEVPYYLQFVTGELKTRAPAQAAKNEAKEKGTADEDRAHIEGLMALASRPSQDADQAMTPPVTQDETLLPNTHVPMADMGIGSQVNGDEYPIDPRVTSLAASGTKITGFSTEVAAGGMAGIGVPEQDLSKHRP